MQSNPLASLSVKQLKRAIAIRGKIEALQKSLDRIGGGEAPAAPKSRAPRKKRRMSAAARAKISAAAKARWASFRRNKAAK